MQSSLIRQRTSLKDTILEELNKQMIWEAKSSSSYLAMSAWCHVQGLQGCASFFRKQSGEEREHMLKIFDYIADAGALAVSPEVTGIDTRFDGLRDIFEKALDMEIAITERFNYLTELCHSNKDYQTAKFLQWYLDEQLEEEDTARRCLELFDLITPANDGLYQIDKAVAKLHGNE